MTGGPRQIDAFIDRWQGQEGGQERANYALFLSELCDVLGVGRPEPASASTEDNDYVFERCVQRPAADGTHGLGRIDLYKRGCFVLEAKQSRQPGGAKELGVPHLPGLEPPKRGVRDASRTWDVLMLNARRQAEGYARALPVAHGWPPFILVCDVGHVIETYADFSGQGKNYAQFPDRQSFRVYLEDLRHPEIRERLARIWTDPLHLDPARETARVTRGIAERLAAVLKALEDQGHDAEDVAMFLMRCLFTMFACSRGIELLPEASFRDLLQRCEADPSRFVHMVGQLWEAMDSGDFAFALEAKVRRFNGEFFRTRSVLPLGRAEIGELRRAASADWKDVDPSIFGTLLEQALDKTERRRLGAHYTPRAYVERLVVATVIEPLRGDWEQALSTAERQKAEGRAKEAVATVRGFHDTLCKTRVLDPACGTGNFLYVSLELVKRLEGEVLEALANLGGQEALTGLEGHTVDPRQFFGLEINPRAAAIAELVLWIGYLQWHFRIKGGMPGEPILRAFHNIIVRDAILEATRVLRRHDDGTPVVVIDTDGRQVEAYSYDNPRRPDWPDAEFIVGNPPFIGKGEPMREALGQGYLDALWLSHPEMNESADLVMYWWDHAATLIRNQGTILRRFGLVTTNSINQYFNRRVIDRHLRAEQPVSLVMAIPNHPWTKATRDAAAVRIAMTVVQAGKSIGIFSKVVKESQLDTDEPIVDLESVEGLVNPDLTVGVDVTLALGLTANTGLASMGPALGGRGFVLGKTDIELLGFVAEPHSWLKRLTTGKDITERHRNRYVIDVRHFATEQALRRALPSVYQHLKTTVYLQRMKNNDPKLREFWWLFRRSNEIYHNATADLDKFIATVETAKHRVFIFVEPDELLEHGVIGFGSSDAWFLGVLSSHMHVVWSLANGGTLEDRPRYNKDVCFDPFPFPAADDVQKNRIRTIAEDLDAHRKRVLAEHSHLTLTGLYNVLEKLRAGTAPGALDTADRRIFDDGLVLILKEYHDALDEAVAAAYGWPADLGDNEILARLVALNQDRVREEAAGQIRWLRPDYQIPRFGSVRDKLDLTGGAMNQAAAEAATGPKPAFPGNELEQTAAVLSVLSTVSEPASATALAVRFRQGRRVLPQVEAVLAALVRVGGLVTSPDGGRSFLPRRAA
jgi:SAM-dependent methyltransferase